MSRGPTVVARDYPSQGGLAEEEAMTSPVMAPEKPPSHSHVRRAWLSAGISPTAAAALAIAVLALGWKGSDLPAQIFRADLIKRYGFVLWNMQWYGGHPTLDYS